MKPVTKAGAISWSRPSAPTTFEPSNEQRVDPAHAAAVATRVSPVTHGLLALIRPSAGQVCHSLIVVSNWMPGSAQAHAAYEILSHSARACSVLCDLTCRCGGCSFHSRPSSTAWRNVVGDADRVVRVLARDREVALRVPVELVDGDLDLPEALLGEPDHAHHVAHRDLEAPRLRHRLAQRRGSWCGRSASSSFLVGPQHDFITAFKRGSASCCPRRGPRPSAPRSTFQSTNVSMSGWSTSRQTIFAARRVVPPDLIAPAARSPIFRNDMRPDDLPPPERGSFSPRRRLKFVPVPEPYLKRRASRTQRSMMPPSSTRSSADALDEAGVRLGALVGRGRRLDLARLRVDVEVALRGAVDAVREVQPRVEPLGAVRRAALVGEHAAHLVVERLRVLRRVEVAVGLAPVAPAARQAVEDLPRVLLARRLRLAVLDARLRTLKDRLAVGADHRHAAAAEVLLGEDVGRDARPRGRHRDLVVLEDDAAVRVLDLRDAPIPGDALVGIPTGDGEAARDLHERAFPATASDSRGPLGPRGDDRRRRTRKTKWKGRRRWQGARRPRSRHPQAMPSPVPLDLDARVSPRSPLPSRALVLRETTRRRAPKVGFGKSVRLRRADSTRQGRPRNGNSLLPAGPRPVEAPRDFPKAQRVVVLAAGCPHRRDPDLTQRTRKRRPACPRASGNTTGGGGQASKGVPGPPVAGARLRFRRSRKPRHKRRLGRLPTSTPPRLAPPSPPPRPHPSAASRRPLRSPHFPARLS